MRHQVKCESMRDILSVVILTYNEEENLPVCLASLEELDVQVFIVDSGSQDRTVEIAEQAGCQVIYHEFVNHANQVNWALDALEIQTPWVMRLDADERLTPKLARELCRKLTGPEGDISGYRLKRRVYFWGKWIRYGGYYPTWLLRVWKRGCARSEMRWMDEHMVLSSGRMGTLRHDIIDENHKGLSFWTSKHNDYAEREVQDILNLSPEENTAQLTRQAARKRWLKRNWYARSPLFFRAFSYWFLRYFVLLGFLDGRAGLVFHFLQGFWYRFLVDAKLHEYRRRMK